jgi:pilus assembly protein Flp/PilA
MRGGLPYSRFCVARQTIRALCVRLWVLKNALLHEEGGQDLIEYALVVSLLVLGAVAAISQVSTALTNAFSRVGSKLGSYTH